MKEQLKKLGLDLARKMKKEIREGKEPEISGFCRIYTTRMIVPDEKLVKACEEDSKNADLVSETFEEEMRKDEKFQLLERILIGISKDNEKEMIVVMSVRFVFSPEKTLFPTMSETS